MRKEQNRWEHLYQAGKLLYGGDYNPEQWLDRPDILTEDIRLMKQAKINVATLGVFSWSVLEPEEGNYQFDWLEHIIEKLYANGIYTVLATPSGGRPVWLDEAYPEALRVDKDGVRHLHGVRHNHCMTSPAFRRKIRQMDEKLAERFGKNPAVLLWHISNELGGECFCPLCQKKFQDYLKEKFHGDIEELNKAWWTTFWSHKYQSFSQVAPPFSHGETSIMGLNLEWKRFTTWNMTDYMREEIAVFRALTPDIPVTTNFMKLYPGLDYRVLARELDIISWDSYPRFHNDYETFADTMLENSFDHAVMRSMKKDRPFLLMESAPGMVNWHPANKMQRPGVGALAAVQAVANGGDAAMYFQWRMGRGSFEQYHGAVLDHRGSADSRIYREAAEKGVLLEKLAEVKKSTIKAEAAVLFDWDNRWAIADMAALSGDRKDYEAVCREQYEALLKLGIETDIISREDKLEDYKLIVAPMLYLLTADTAEKLKAFVGAGGQLAATYLCGWVDENTLCFEGGFPGNGLTDLFGLYIEEMDSLYPSERNAAVFSEGVSYEIRDFAEVIKNQSADVLAVYESDYYAKEPVVTQKQYGEGMAWYIGARISRQGMRHIYSLACAKAGITCTQMPEGIEYHRRYGDGVCYDFYLNYGGTCVELPGIAGEELLSGEKVRGSLKLQPWQACVIKLQSE